jgi:glutamate N-acetyltransferase/amino-acid N-acetyltransferase
MRLDEMIEPIDGFRACGIDSGLRAYFGKIPGPDLALIAAEGPCAAVGMFTTNRVRAAPVTLDEARLKHDPEHIQAVLINAACANACTGELGLRNAEQAAAWTAQALGIHPERVLVMSTGVIGVHLPMACFETGIPKAVEALHTDGWNDAAKAIMTTDTRPKRAYAEFSGIRMAGIAKGAGMIAPNMATLLSLVVTDAVIPVPLLRLALREAVEHSFNRIVIDGDMSTNDTVLLLASGVGGAHVTEEDFPEFTRGLTAICASLAQSIVRDGEGATRFIELRVKGARTAQEAHQIANTIAASPLVKTAFYGGDANWGRILAAAGRAGVEIDAGRLSLQFEDMELVRDGVPLDYDDERANHIAGHSELSVALDLGLGSAEATIWTCDLSHDYVTINGHYRT